VRKIALVALVLAACDGGQSHDCYGNYTCNDGLVCVHWTLENNNDTGSVCVKENLLTCPSAPCPKTCPPPVVCPKVEPCPVCASPAVDAGAPDAWRRVWR
jgi:hypothetical protein